ncbi:hypothetical protein F7Q99_31405 [Streptomyces kaniharaensis]|uniref:Uncharacterized protein n=1 Tax=Streptomyces kaniharaensis TaxID=212423 RepID=A0A6N7KY15_9ACTN|nr:hypothetical protein [Streptomyces kaniharaensis]MQS16576.1 hypothetical protein [Streptomyces kaniharaensis]
MTNPSTAAADWARTVLDRLGLGGRCRIDVTTVPEGRPSPLPGPDAPYHSALTIGPPGEPDGPDGPPPEAGVHVTVTLDAEWTRVHLPPDLAPADALVLLADRLQDWAIELTHGAALPPCPGHAHPMRAAVVDGAAVWCCPARPEGTGTLLPIA